jgi:hypothetical protein
MMMMMMMMSWLFYTKITHALPWSNDGISAAIVAADPPTGQLR